MKRYKLFTLLSLCAFCANLSASISLQSKRYSAKDGIACNTINAVTQDKDGFIWLATANGISRFDGYSFVNFTQLGIGEKTESAINISLLLNDYQNGLLWGYTPQHDIYCYQLSKGGFADYTGTNNLTAPYKNRCLTQDGIWLYSNKSGATHIIYENGTFRTKNYTEQNHLLLSSDNLSISEDKLHHVWITSNKGVQRISPNGESQILLKNQAVKLSTLSDQYFAVLTVKGDAFIYRLDGKLIKRSHLPAVMPITGKSRASMFWQGSWYIFSEGTTYAMDMRTGRFYQPKLQIPNAIDKNPLHSFTCLFDKQGNLYLFSKNGWSKKLHLIETPSLFTIRDRNFTVAEDVFGRLFIATYGNGLYVYNPKDDQLDHFSAQDPSPLIDNDYLLSIFIDNTNCAWISSGFGLYQLTEIDGIHHQYVKIQNTSSNDWSNSVRHINYIGNGKMVASNKNNETYLIDAQNNQTSLLQKTNAVVYSYQKDAQGHTWIATKGAGISVDGKKYNTKDPIYHIPSDKIFDFAFDKQGRTWIATWGGGLLLTQYHAVTPLAFQQFLNVNYKDSQIHDLLLDKTGKLWICSNNGIIMVNTFKKKTTPKDFTYFNSSTCQLPSDQILCGVEAKDGTLWFGTKSGILKCKYQTEANKLQVEVINTTHGLINNSVRSIAEDNLGNMWIATEEGLSRINLKNRKVKSFLLSDNITQNTFVENCYTRLPDGRIAFGTEKGILFIKPEADKYPQKTTLKVTLTDMTVNGISIFDKTLGEICDKALNYTKEITLPHDKNSLSISFSNFFYPEIGSAIYQYYLEGIDKTWRPATSLNHADFSDLHPGSYILHLRTLNINNKWSEETTLKIIIEQPWYNTWWAWLLYLIILGGIGVFMYREWRKNFDLHQQMKIDKQMTDFRIDFFTHISHEFRTPLAIIQGAVEKLSNSPGISYQRNTLQTLNRGSKRLLRLVNQLMEFRKINTGNMRLFVRKGDVVNFVRNIYDDLRTIAKQKDINMSFTPWRNSYEIYFDKQKLETIVYNLLSNAVKYTPDKGNITCHLFRQEKKLVFTVEDSGPGIKPEQEATLFQPFMHGYVSVGGMGIGLYTASQMAKLHKGELTYERSTDLGGCLFRLVLPCEESAYQPEEILHDSAIETNSIDKEEIANIVKEMTPKAINDITVMVIEDDPDMMQQIKSELSIYFHVEAFMNGKIGYENIRKIKPALLICDIMLPDMSGYDIVSNMKADTETQDIPVIMLTALDDTNHILKAYKSFVDDYMVKPYNFKLLIARALQFVASDWKAKQLEIEAEAKKENIEKATTETAPSEDTEGGTTEGENIQIKPVKELKPLGNTILMSALDKKFKDKLEAIVAQHLDDNTFSVDKLAELLNMGRTSVYTRTKNVLGVSPNMYIQNERLRLAAKLLLEGELTVAQISDKVGFADTTYFHKCFKNKFGVTPGKYGK